MKLIYAGVTSAVIAAGLVGSVAAYRSQTEPVTKTVSVQQPKPRAVVQWAPCKAPSKLEDGVCITDEVRTVMRPAPPVSAPAAPSYSAVTTPSYSAATTPNYSAQYGTQSPVGVREGDDDAYGEDREDEREDERGDEREDHDSEDVHVEDVEDHADEQDESDEAASDHSDNEDHEDEH